MAKHSPSNHSNLHNPSRVPLSDLELPPQWRYEDTIATVETIIQRIESGELDLATTFDEFAIAIDHLRQCDEFLAQQKQKMDLLIETLIDDSDPF